MKFETIKKVTLTEQIMEKIAGMVLSGELKAGDKLPNERLLAEQFGVARGRIREALRALSLVGMVTIRAGDGTYISEQGKPLPEETITWMFQRELHDLDELYDARRLIESAVIMNAMQHLTQDDFDQLDHLLERLSSYAKHEDHDAIVFMQLLDQYDALIGERCGNRIYTKLLQTMLQLRRDTSLKLVRVPGSIEQSVTTREIILQALKKRDPVQLEAAIDNFFQTAKTFFSSIGQEGE
jgi:GntR family transcriptional repressor for pyruvate dehydrogenase complex